MNMQTIALGERAGMADSTTLNLPIQFARSTHADLVHERWLRAERAIGQAQLH